MIPQKRVRNDSETSILNVPPDVMILIFSKFKHEDLLPLSLVCNYFRSLTCGFVHKLSFNHVPSISVLQKLFARYYSVKRIAITASRLTRTLTTIANSGLKIECLDICAKYRFPRVEQIDSLSGKFGHVKSLKLQWFGNDVELQIVGLVQLFPSLEKLDLCCFTTSDLRIEKLVPHIPNLCMISVNDNIIVTDLSLGALLNCPNLEHVSIPRISSMTLQGFSAFVRKSKNLKRLDVPHSFKFIEILLKMIF